MPNNKPVLSILICHLEDREEKFSTLEEQIIDQMMEHCHNGANCSSEVGVPLDKDKPLGYFWMAAHRHGDVELLVATDAGEMSIGAKRNKLLLDAQGEYICFVDDDDRVSDDYVEKILLALKSLPDVVGIVGWYTEGNKPPKKFIHSTQYTEWSEDDETYYRTPNHLNPVKRLLALKAGFPDQDHGEDHEYSKKLQAVMVMDCDCNQVEVFIPEPIYFYDK